MSTPADGAQEPPLAALTLHDLDALFARWNEPRYRAKQVFEAVQKRGVLDPDAMTTLPRTLRTRLAGSLAIGM